MAKRAPSGKASEKKPATKKAPGKPRGPRKPAPKATKAVKVSEMKGAAPAAIEALSAQVVSDGGVVFCHYQEPFGGFTVLLVGLPIDKVEPTSWQRDTSKPHVARLARSIEKVGRFLDPVIAVRQDGKYLVPNGAHRLAALREAGGQSIVALLVPEVEVAHKILALNTEKAHALKEKALEVVRLERVLAAAGDPRKEAQLDVELEEGALVTIGMAYELKPRVSGSTYMTILKRVDPLQDLPLTQALERRTALAKQVIEADEHIGKIVDALKARGMRSPYLKAFVVARINPMKSADAPATAEAALASLIEKAKGFDASKVREEDLAAAGGPPGGGGEGEEGGE